MIERALRFPPDPADHAILSFGTGEFRPDLQALITDETPNAGCGLVLFAHPSLGIGTQLRIQIGTRPPVPAQVVWMKELPQGLRQAGLKLHPGAP